MMTQAKSKQFVFFLVAEFSKKNGKHVAHVSVEL